MKSKNWTKYVIVYFLYAIIIGVLTYIIVLLISDNGIYPSGSDTMYHVYRGQYVYESISRTDFFPLLNEYWYNGVELLRYWPWFTAYLMAFFNFLCDGDIFNGYIMYVAFIFVAGSISWAYIGARLKRPVLGCIVGVLWFITPNNLYALFGEGNLPRALSMVFLPLYIFCIYNYYLNGKAIELAGIIVTTVLIVMCHLGYGGMVVLATLSFMVIYCIINSGMIIRSLKILISVILGFLITGIYMVPSLFGGMSASDSEGKLKIFFKSILETLNPFYRINTNIDTFYFGLAAFILIVIGIIGSKKEQEAGFVNALIILLLTTNQAYYFVKILPGSGFLWMVRFISIALCFMFMSFMFWNSLKRYMVVLMCILLLVDSVPSWYYIYGDRSGITPNERFSMDASESLIDEAKSITKQRLALLDLAALGADGAYLTAEYDGKTKTMFGAGWEASVTSSNITQVNYALEQGYYLYMFDRLKELGNDTVLIKKSAIYMQYNGEIDYNLLLQDASRSGYSLVDSNEGWYLFKLNIDYASWGTVNAYRGIAIGDSSGTIALNYPCIEETSDTNINHYTYDDLRGYDFVFLSGFTYDDKESAEQLVKDLSDKGIRFVIVGDTIPEDKKERISSFLGVSAQVISFNNGYPLLYDEKLGWMDCDLFPKEYANWQTHYLNGLDKATGYFRDNELTLDYCGTVYNDNITFVGLGLPYYLSLTKDDSINELMSNIFKLNSNMLPNRRVVPLDVTYYSAGVNIKSRADNVNTSISYHDIYNESDIKHSNNMLFVDKGVTKVTYHYPYLVQGLLVSLFGLVFSYIFIKLSKKREEPVIKDEQFEQQS